MKQWEFSFELVPRQKDKRDPLAGIKQLEKTAGPKFKEPTYIESEKFGQKLPFINLPTMGDRQLGRLLGLESPYRRLRDFYRQGLEVAKQGTFEHHLVVVSGPGVSAPIYFDTPLTFILIYYETLDMNDASYSKQYDFVHYAIYDELQNAGEILLQQLKLPPFVNTEFNKQITSMVEQQLKGAEQNKEDRYGEYPPEDYYLLTPGTYGTSYLMSLIDNYHQLCQKHPKEIGFYIDHAQLLLKVAKTKKIESQRLMLIRQAQQSIDKAKKLDTKLEWERVYHLDEAITEWLANPMLESAAPVKTENLKTFNGYDITLDTRIGSGASGDVYKGTWKSELVAVKRMDATHWNPAKTAEFIGEAHFMMNIRSDYVVKAYDLVASQPNFLLVMPYMHCGDLMKLLESKTLTYPEKIVIAKDIAHGLSDLHAQGIIHRDIKSLNILVNDKKRAKIADMGHAKFEIKVNIDLYQSTRTVHGNYGTIEWKSPEIIENPGLVGAPSDVYALGMTLWEIGTGRKPFETIRMKISRDELEQRIAQGAKEDLSAITREVPKLAKIIKQCWEVRNKRATASEVLNALNTIEETELVTGTTIPINLYVSALNKPDFLSKP